MFILSPLIPPRDNFLESKIKIFMHCNHQEDFKNLVIQLDQTVIAGFSLIDIKLFCMFCMTTGTFTDSSCLPAKDWTELLWNDTFLTRTISATNKYCGLVINVIRLSMNANLHKMWADCLWVFGNIHVYIYIYVSNKINKKRSHNFERVRKEMYMEVFQGKKGKGWMCNYIIISKIGRKNECKIFF